ncbi:MAG: toxin-antitoxin system YwqK family antitoxin [Kordia sp.]|uniref:toxin-antitoxin system YwqK family antitoxin n=1 Tax=Kordia sp. TaxID=1965332 RepID=UPI0038594471
MKHLLIIICLSVTFSASAQKKYKKSYFDNGQLQEEGWTKKGVKIKHWKFYYQNGALKKQGSFKNGKPAKYWYFYRANGTKESAGHFVNGKKSKWWLFFDMNGNVNHKCQLKNNQKNGYCLRYMDEELIRAEKYQNGKKIGEWTDLKSFKKENSVWDLK